MKKNCNKAVFFTFSKNRTMDNTIYNENEVLPTLQPVKWYKQQKHFSFQDCTSTEAL